MGKNIHSSFETHFIRKVRSLGYKVLPVNEFFTSQKCPRKNCGAFTESIGMRVKYCRKCRQYYHRDVMAGENMSNIIKSELQGNGRPDYLKRDVNLKEFGTISETSKKRKGKVKVCQKKVFKYDFTSSEIDSSGSEEYKPRKSTKRCGTVH